MEALAGKCPKCERQVEKLGPKYIVKGGIRWIVCDECAAALEPGRVQIGVVVKEGPKVVGKFKGHAILTSNITVDQLQSIYRLEAALEAITGLRWHISMTDEDFDEAS